MQVAFGLQLPWVKQQDKVNTLHTNSPQPFLSPECFANFVVWDSPQPEIHKELNAPGLGFIFGGVVV